MRLGYLLAALLALSPTLAHAAEAAFAVIEFVGFITTVGGGIVVTASLVIGVAVYGSAQQRKAARAARDAYNASLKDHTITRIATEAPIRYVYGTARVGSDIVAVLTSGDKDQYKHIVSVHASHECEAIEQVYINGKVVGALDADGNPLAASFVADTVSGSDQLTSVNSTTGTVVVGMVISGTNIPGDTYVKAIDGSTFTMSRAATGSASGVAVTAKCAYTKTETRHMNETRNVQAGVPVTLTYQPRGITFIHYKTDEGNVNWPVGVSSKTVVFPQTLGDVTFSYNYDYVYSTVRVQKHLGGPSDPADASLISEIPSKWDSTKLLRGLCYTVVRIDLNESEFQGGMPSIEVLLKGKKLYDLRTGTTHWSDNPVLAIYDYLTSDMCGVDKNDLPKAQLIAAANVCDENIGPSWLPFGITFPRYTINGVVNSDEDPKGVLERMAQCMAGSIVSTTWDIYAGKYLAPIMALQQEDIVGNLSISPGISDADLYNGVKGQYVGPENNYTADDFKPYQNAAYYAADGVEKWTNIDFTFTNTVQRVHNLCRIFTEDQRNSYTVKAEFSQKAWRLKVGDRVTLTSALFGWDNKVFRVTDKQFSPTTAVELTLKEDDTSIWDFADAVVPDSTPNSNLPSPFYIEGFDDITVMSGNDTLLLGQDGTIISRILATWPKATTQSVINNGLIELEWAPVGTEIWQKISVSGNETQTYLSPVEDGETYWVRIRSVNPYFNVKSSWTYVHHTVIGKTQPPPDVLDFAFTLTDDGARQFSFSTAGQPVDVTHGGGYRIKYRAYGSTAAWADMTQLHDGLITQSPYETRSPAAGTYDFAIVAVDSSGNESVNAELLDNVTVTDSNVAAVALNAVNALIADFNASNNRNGAAIVAPTIATDGTAVDHTLQKNGSADISFEWSWTGDNADIDGFLVYVHQSSSSAAYTFGSAPATEQAYTVPANKRAFILFGAVSDQYYSFAVQGYRYVDKAINSNGVIVSTLVADATSGENPYRPSANVAFAGDVVGTVNGIDATDVNQWSAVSGAGKPADNATVGATFGVNITGAITPSNASTYIQSGAVATTHLADNAASQMVYTKDASTHTYYGGPRPSGILNLGSTILELQITTAGGNVAVDAFANLNIKYINSGEYLYLSFAVYCVELDGSLKFLGPGAYYSNDQNTSGYMTVSAMPYSSPVTVISLDTNRPAGTWTYRIMVRDSSSLYQGYAYTLGNVSLKLREIKK